MDFMAEEIKWIGWMDTVDPQTIKPGSAVGIHHRTDLG